MYTGQLVDARNWPNRALLERQGYIEPLEETRVQDAGAVTEVPVTDLATPATARTKRRRAQ